MIAHNIYLTVRLLARDFCEVIVGEGEARINRSPHGSRGWAIKLFWSSQRTSILRNFWKIIWGQIRIFLFPALSQFRTFIKAESPVIVLEAMKLTSHDFDYLLRTWAFIYQAIADKTTLATYCFKAIWDVWSITFYYDCRI